GDRIVAISTGAGGKHHALHSRLSRRLQDIERAGRIDFIIESWLFNTARHRAQRGLVEDILAASRAARKQIAIENRAFHKLYRRKPSKIGAIAAAEIIKNDHRRSELREHLGQ